MKKGIRERMKETGKPVSFAISNCPVALYEEFVEGIREQYGDQYCHKLRDLIRKAEAYDLLVSMHFAQPIGMQEQFAEEQESVQMEEKEEKEKILFNEDDDEGRDLRLQKQKEFEEKVMKNE